MKFLGMFLVIYLPLPATFIYDDAKLDDRTWVDELNKKHQFSGTVYQISSNDEGKPMYFFLFGMSFFYSIFYFIGHYSADWFGFAQDGFSTPYQLALVYGSMLYTLIGLVYFRKILKFFFSDKLVAVILLLIVFATNYTHHMTLKNLETVNVLFMLCSILVWNTIQWHESKRTKNLIGIGLSLTLMALVKPSEILLILLPLLWNVTNRKSFIEKLKLILNYRNQFILVFGICFLVTLPQIAYWYLKTGHIIYDTYKNPGVGLDLLNPHLLETLFSYRKGWLVYTPIMVFALLGFISMRKKNPQLFPAILITFLIVFYIVGSWTEWWYGAGFSMRPLITYYPLLAIPFGYFLLEIRKSKLPLQLFFGVTLVSMTCLNQFQWWQLRNYILDPYYTTKDYYWAIFLKTHSTEDDKKLLSFQRDFTGNASFDNPNGYVDREFFSKNFNELAAHEFVSLPEEEFAFTQFAPYYELTQKDHAWLKFTFRYKTDNEGEIPLFATMMDRKEGSYGYKTFDLENTKGEWIVGSFYYLTPSIRSEKDELKYYFWKRSKCNLYIDDFKIEVYSPKK